jgi:hypothetical protein
LWTIGGMIGSANQNTISRKVQDFTLIGATSGASATPPFVAKQDFNGVVMQTKQLFIPGGRLYNLASDSFPDINPLPWGDLYGDITDFHSMSQLLNGRHYVIIGAHRGMVANSKNVGQSRDIWSYEPVTGAWAYVGAFGNSAGPGIGGMGQWNLEHRLATPVVRSHQIVMTGVTQGTHGNNLVPDQTVWVWPGVQFTALFYGFTTAPLNSLATLTFQFGVTGQLNPGSVLTIYVPNVDLISHGQSIRTSVPLEIRGPAASHFTARWSPLSPRVAVIQSANYTLDLLRLQQTAFKMFLVGQSGLNAVLRSTPIVQLRFGGAASFIDLYAPLDVGTTSAIFPRFIDVVNWGGLTISCWVLADPIMVMTDAYEPRVFGFRNTASNVHSIGLYRDSTARFRFVVGDATGADLFVLSPPMAAVTGVWYHIAVTCDARDSRCSLWINGRTRTHARVRAPIW